MGYNTGMATLKETIMLRDEMTSDEADDLIAEFKEELKELLESGEGSLEDAETLMKDYFDLEPDYLDDFLLGFACS